jgi:hypothetical protein
MVDVGEALARATSKTSHTTGSARLGGSGMRSMRPVASRVNWLAALTCCGMASTSGAVGEVPADRRRYARRRNHNDCAGERGCALRSLLRDEPNETVVSLSRATAQSTHASDRGENVASSLGADRDPCPAAITRNSKITQQRHSYPELRWPVEAGDQALARR